MAKQPRLSMIGHRIARAEIRRIVPPPKQADPYYLSDTHRAWVALVRRKAGYRCEKCGCQDPPLYADHVIELRDGGSPTDPFNGQLLCSRCHTIKTNRERAKRMNRRA